MDNRNHISYTTKEFHKYLLSNELYSIQWGGIEKSHFQGNTKHLSLSKYNVIMINN